MEPKYRDEPRPGTVRDMEENFLLLVLIFVPTTPPLHRPMCINSLCYTLVSSDPTDHGKGSHHHNS